MLTSEYIGSYDGTLLHYKVNRRPRNPTLVFIHGAGSNHTAWRRVVGMFADRSYIVMDLRNHGLSGFGKFSIEAVTRDIAAALKHEKIKEFIPVGMSLGAPIALQLAKRFPEKAKGFVLISPSSRAITRFSRTITGTMKFLRGMCSVLPLRKRLRFVKHTTKIPLIFNPFRELIGIHLRDFACAAQTGVSNEIDFDNVKQPGLIMSGSADVLVRKKVLLRKIANHPNIVHRELPTHHLILDRAPRQAAQLISEFAGD